MKAYLFIVGLTSFISVLFGLVLPALFSGGTEAVILGVVLVVSTPPIIYYGAKRVFFKKKEEEKNDA